jgi:hypothetical protein
MYLNEDIFPVASGSGRSARVIPAVPAASSVTTIAFIGRLPVSSLRFYGTSGRKLLASPKLGVSRQQMSWWLDRLSEPHTLLPL